MSQIHPCPEALQDRIKACRACALNQPPYEPGLPTIGIGSKADLFLLGRDPGRNEALVGKPFVGLAGTKVLQPILQELSIGLDDFYLTNCVKHRPPDNKEPSDEIKLICSDFLAEEIEWCQPKIIIALGQAAAQSLNILQGTGSPVIRGTRSWYKDIPVIATWHPAYVLRNLNGPAFTELKADIQLARSYALALRGTNANDTTST